MNSDTSEVKSQLSTYGTSFQNTNRVTSDNLLRGRDVYDDETAWVFRVDKFRWYFVEILFCLLLEIREYLGKAWRLMVRCVFGLVCH
jgi:hypothetical protein